ncbi:MAG: FGGY family carbohydrate kinase [Sphingomonas fennica]
MAAPIILAIDQGTTNTKALLVDPAGAIVAQAARPMTLHHPREGWAEQSAETIWDSVAAVIAEVAATPPGSDIAAIAISNQRETIVLWEAASGRPVAPAISWQCRRSSDRCAALREAGHAGRIRALTGLDLDPLFPAGKLGWLLDTVDRGRARAAAGELRAGTIDSWLLWKLTGGAVHATDPGNAARTQLFDLGGLRWDGELAAFFGVPIAILPDVRASDSRFGETAAGACALPAGVPVQAMMGDSHAALFAYGTAAPDHMKVTIGTGSSVMAPCPAALVSRHGLSRTIGWGRDGTVLYALEGNITVSGQAAAFMAGLLGLEDVAALAALAESVPDSGGVTFVPALAGLGAPHWRDRARGLLSGLSLGTRPAHLARAAMDAIAFQIGDVVAAMEADLGRTAARLLVDGGASRNDRLLQRIADVTGRSLQRNPQPEASALGVARMAAGAIGLAPPPPPPPSPEDLFAPLADPAGIAASRAAWRDAIDRATLRT